MSTSKNTKPTQLRVGCENGAGEETRTQRRKTGNVGAKRGYKIRELDRHTTEHTRGGTGRNYGRMAGAKSGNSDRGADANPCRIHKDVEA
jgi:hypothetical protein